MTERPKGKAEFAELGLSEDILAKISELGFVHPTPIQAEAIPLALSGRDVIGKAQTGTGKTMAFGLPLLERVDASRISAQALVLLPTRELAQQVADALEPLAEVRGLQVALLVGGEKVRLQRVRIPRRQIIVGTPGRILDLLRENMLHIEWAEYLVLDEFDRMLDMGFIDDVTAIIKYLPDFRQTMLFSATVPPGIIHLANSFMRDPVRVEVSAGLQTASGITQRAIRVDERDRFDLLMKLLDGEAGNERTALIFSNTRRMVSELDRELWGRGLAAASLCGDLDQAQRFRVMDGFREGRIRILVATDVASRGLDVDHVGHVINFDVPLEPEDYVHRIGRTGRAGRDGIVTTLVIPKQERHFSRIQDAFGAKIKLGRVVATAGRVRSGPDVDERSRGRASAPPGRSVGRGRPSAPVSKGRGRR